MQIKYVQGCIPVGCVPPQGSGGHAWQVGVHGKKEGMHGRGEGCVWQRMCDRGHAWQRGMCGRGACKAVGHVWLGAYMAGGMHGVSMRDSRGACMAGDCVWQGACVARTSPSPAP